MIGAEPGIDGSLRGAAAAVAELDRLRSRLRGLDRYRFDRELRRATDWSWSRWVTASKQEAWDALALELLAGRISGLEAEARAQQRTEDAERLAECRVGAARAAATLREIAAERRTAVWGSGRKW